MIRIMGALPVKTRLPMTAWAFAAIVTLFSVASTLMQFTPSGDSATLAEQAHHASAADFVGFLRQL